MMRYYCKDIVGECFVVGASHRESLYGQRCVVFTCDSMISVHESGHSHGQRTMVQPFSAIYSTVMYCRVLDDCVVLSGFVPVGEVEDFCLVRVSE